MRRTYEADLFFKIAGNIDALAREQAQKESMGQEVVEQWWEQLLDVLEDFGYFANRKLLPKDMIEYFIPTIVEYCDCASAYSESLRKKLADRVPDGYSEIRKIYE